MLQIKSTTTLESTIVFRIQQFLFATHTISGYTRIDMYINMHNELLSVCLQLYTYCYTGARTFVCVCMHVCVFVCETFFSSLLIWVQRKGNYLLDAHSLVTIRTNASSFIIFCTIIISTVIKCSISFSNWTSTTLIHKMPIEANEWSVLITFVLQKT